MPDEARLPPLVERAAERALGAGVAVPRRIRLVQEGEMRQKPDANWQRFTAVEELATGEVGFAWNARFPMGRLVSIRVRDEFSSGQGALVARVLGVPVMRQRGPDTTLGQALRYLAELPWVPHAYRANDALAWRELDERTAEVSTPAGAATAVVRLEVDGQGDVLRAFAEGRPYKEAGPGETRPWGGSFAGYAELAGVRIPTRGEVAWELPEGRFVYWRGTVTAAELVA